MTHETDKIIGMKKEKKVLFNIFIDMNNVL